MQALVRDGYCFTFPLQSGMPVFTLYKTDTQARLIADARVFNKLWPKPPTFVLPSFSALMTALIREVFYFIKIDIENCFWSLTLPAHVSGHFVYTTAAPSGLPCSYGLRAPTIRVEMEPYYRPAQHRHNHRLSGLPFETLVALH